MRRQLLLAALILTSLAHPLRASASAGDPTIGIPSPANSTVPAAISLVGLSGNGVPAALGNFVVIVRRLSNTPWPNIAVDIDFNSALELWISGDPQDASAFVNCPARTIRKYTDIDGRVEFTIAGGSNGVDMASASSRATIYAGGVLLGSPIVASFDLDGQGGLGANDLSVFLLDFAAQNDPNGYRPRADFDGSGSVGANDFSVWLTAFGSSSMTQSASAVCP